MHILLMDGMICMSQATVIHHDIHKTHINKSLYDIYYYCRKILWWIYCPLMIVIVSIVSPCCLKVLFHLSKRILAADGPPISIGPPTPSCRSGQLVRMSWIEGCPGRPVDEP